MAPPLDQSINRPGWLPVQGKITSQSPNRPPREVPEARKTKSARHGAQGKGDPSPRIPGMARRERGKGGGADGGTSRRRGCRRRDARGAGRRETRPRRVRAVEGRRRQARTEEGRVGKERPFLSPLFFFSFGILGQRENFSLGEKEKDRS